MEMSRQTREKQSNIGTHATEQADGPKCRQKFKQQRQQCQGHFIFNLRIPQEFRFIQFVYHGQKYSKQNM